MNPKQVQLLKSWIDDHLGDLADSLAEGASTSPPVGAETILDEIEDTQTLRRMIEKNFHVDLKKGCKLDPEK